jgi:hypothetical protein
MSTEGVPLDEEGKRNDVEELTIASQNSNEAQQIKGRVLNRPANEVEVLRAVVGELGRKIEKEDIDTLIESGLLKETTEEEVKAAMKEQPELEAMISSLRAEALKIKEKLDKQKRYKEVQVELSTTGGWTGFIKKKILKSEQRKLETDGVGEKDTGSAIELLESELENTYKQISEAKARLDGVYKTLGSKLIGGKFVWPTDAGRELLPKKDESSDTSFGGMYGGGSGIVGGF